MRQLSSSTENLHNGKEETGVFYLILGRTSCSVSLSTRRGRPKVAVLALRGAF